MADPEEPIHWNPQVKEFPDYAPPSIFQPKRQFNLPSFFFHIGANVGSKSHVEQFHPTLDNLDKYQDFQMKFDKIGAIIQGVLASGSTTIAHHFRSKLKKCSAELESTCESVLFENVQIQWKYGRLYAGDDQLVYMILDGDVTNLEIRKFRLFEKSKEIHILILFESNFMASGKIIKKDKEFVAKIKEIPESYGTADFMVDKQFKMLLRRAQVPRQTPGIDRENSTLQNVQLTLKELYTNYSDAWSSAKVAQEQHMFHKKGDDLITNLCFHFSTFFRIYDCFANQKNKKFLDQAKKQDKWSPREKLAFLGRKLDECSASPDVFDRFGVEPRKCKIGAKCFLLSKMLRLAVNLVEKPDESEMEPDILKEFSYQVYQALFLFITFLDTEKVKAANRNSLIAYKIMCSFQNLYTLSVQDLILSLEHLPENELRDIVMDAILSRAEPQHFQFVLNSYPKHPELVLDALKRHPHIMVFRSKQYEIPEELLKSFGEFLNWNPANLQRFEKSWMIKPKKTTRKRKTPSVAPNDQKAPKKEPEEQEPGAPAPEDLHNSNTSSEASEEPRGAPPPGPEEPNLETLSESGPSISEEPDPKKNGKGSEAPNPDFPSEAPPSTSEDPHQYQNGYQDEPEAEAPPPDPEELFRRRWRRERAPSRSTSPEQSTSDQFLSLRVEMAERVEVPPTPVVKSKPHLLSFFFDTPDRSMTPQKAQIAQVKKKTPKKETRTVRKSRKPAVWSRMMLRPTRNRMPPSPQLLNKLFGK